LNGYRKIEIERRLGVEREAWSTFDPPSYKAENVDANGSPVEPPRRVAVVAPMRPAAEFAGMFGLVSTYPPADAATCKCPHPLRCVAERICSCATACSHRGDALNLLDAPDRRPEGFHQ
jgi:hypothetical protein